jgi:hypothetical protein
LRQCDARLEAMRSRFHGGTVQLNTRGQLQAAKAAR